jgi:hypothetical protein
MAKTTKAKPRGRPSTFSDELAAEIANRLPFADGGLAEVCAADDMPSETTVYRWLAADRSWPRRSTATSSTSTTAAGSPSNW